MQRRNLLSLVGASSLSGLAGCSSALSAVSLPEVESTKITALDRSCNDSPEGTSTVESEGDDTVIITGTIVVPRIRDSLYITAETDTVFADVNEETIDARIDFGPSDPHANTDVPECLGVIEYRAELTVSKLPSKVVVRHVFEPEGRSYLDTITEQPIN